MYKPTKIRIVEYESYWDSPIPHARVIGRTRKGELRNILLIHDADFVLHHSDPSFSKADHVVCCSGLTVRELTNDPRVVIRWGDMAVKPWILDDCTILHLHGESLEDDPQHIEYLRSL